LRGRSHEFRGFKGDEVPLFIFFPPSPRMERGIKGVRLIIIANIAYLCYTLAYFKRGV